MLPGVSGAYMLLILQRYETILASISLAKNYVLSGGDGDPAVFLAVIIPTALGAIISLVLLSNVLKWLLHHYEKLTLGPASHEGAVYRLAFQADHPEFDLDLGTHGIVQVRLVVPGQGVFSSSADMVRVRPYSAVRDALQQLDGRRFFPGEHVGRTR